MSNLAHSTGSANVGFDQHDHWKSSDFGSNFPDLGIWASICPLPGTDTAVLGGDALPYAMSEPFQGLEKYSWKKEG